MLLQKLRPKKGICFGRLGHIGEVVELTEYKRYFYFFPKVNHNHNNDGCLWWLCWKKMEGVVLRQRESWQKLAELDLMND